MSCSAFVLISWGPNRVDASEATGLTADAVFGPLLPGAVTGGTSQVAIRSQVVADRIKLTWRKP